MLKNMLRRTVAAAASLAVVCTFGGVYAVESEYDYDYQIDVSMFSNAELGTVSGDTVGSAGLEITEGSGKIYINGYEKQ